MKTLWVVVADEAIARILHWPEVGDELEPVEELTDPAAHARGAEFRHDAHGRRAAGGSAASAGGAGAASARSGSGSMASAGESGRHVEAEAFARRVAQHLGQALQQHRFSELRVVAAPRFLGLLRKAFSAPLAAAVSDEMNKDLVHMGNREITDQVFAGKRPGR